MTGTQWVTFPGLAVGFLDGSQLDLNQGGFTGECAYSNDPVEQAAAERATLQFAAGVTRRRGKGYEKAVEIDAGSAVIFWRYLADTAEAAEQGWSGDDDYVKSEGRACRKAATRIEEAFPGVVFR